MYAGVSSSHDCLDRVGIMKCNVLPPRKLYHPILPYISNYKLVFPLCYACVNTMNQGSCTHSDEERSIVGNWLADEVRKAIDMGYGLVEVFKCWMYSVTCTDRQKFRRSFHRIC